MEPLQNKPSCPTCCQLPSTWSAWEENNNGKKQWLPVEPVKTYMKRGGVSVK